MNPTASPLPLAYCGDVVGSFTYNVMCFGYALHGGLCIYLNVTGPATGVMSVIAQMQQDINPLRVVPNNGRGNPVNSGGKTGWYYSTKTALEQVKMLNAIVLSKHFREMPEKIENESTCMYIMQHPSDTDGANVKLKVLSTVTKLVDIPVLYEWGDSIYQLGRDYGLVYPVPKLTDVTAPTIWALSVHKESWEERILAAIAQRKLTIN